MITSPKALRDKVTEKMANQKQVENLSPDECRVLLEMLYVIEEQDAGGDISIVVGAGLDNLDLPPEMLARRGERARAACESLVKRGILVHQYGKEYRDAGYTGQVKNRSLLWYSFDRTIFDEDKGLGQRARIHLAKQLAEIMGERDRSKLAQYAINSVGRFMWSN